MEKGGKGDGSLFHFLNDSILIFKKKCSTMLP